MPTYATQADCLAYSEGLVIDDPGAFDRLIERAERDVDALLMPRTFDVTTGLRIDPMIDLEAWQAAALSRAVCAQVEYRLAMGEDFFRNAQYQRVAGPEFTVDGLLPFLAPKALRELNGSGLTSSTVAGLGSISMGGPAGGTACGGGELLAN